MATTFNTLEDVGKEQRLLFLYDTSKSDEIAPIAYSTTANLSFNADTVDVSNKMDGDWTTVKQGKKSAEVSVDALVSHRENNELVDETELEEAFKDGTSKRFVYAYYNVTQSDDGLSTEIALDVEKPIYTGKMAVSSLELTSDNGDVCKYSCSGASQGAVRKAYYIEFCGNVPIEDGSIEVEDGVENTLFYDNYNQRFLLQVVIEGSPYTYRYWTGAACVDRTEIYDDDENIRQDVIFFDGETFYASNGEELAEITD